MYCFHIVHPYVCEDECATEAIKRHFCLIGTRLYLQLLVWFWIHIRRKSLAVIMAIKQCVNKIHV